MCSNKKFWQNFGKTYIMQYKCKFDERKCNSNQSVESNQRNNIKCQCECKMHHKCKKIILVITLQVVEKMVNT